MRPRTLQEKAGRTYDALKRYADGDLEQQRSAVDDLRQLGTARYVFAGVVRSIVEQSTGLTWDEFVG